MKLYHYAAVRYPELLTKRLAGASIEEIRQTEAKRDRLGLVGAYVDHISYFFDPIPSKTLSELFGKDHDVWYKGNMLFEYVVDVDQCDPKVGYEVVESRRKTAFMDAFVEEHNWVDDNPATLALYMKQLHKLQRQWGETGFSLVGLKKQISLNLGTTQQAYLDAARRDDWEEGKHRYATNVPHVMVYPKSGRMQYIELNKLTIGSDHRQRLAGTQSAGLKW